MIIGLTGGIGAGKSTLTRHYADVCFDCDAEAHKLYEEPEVYEIFSYMYGNLGQNPRFALSEMIIRRPDQLPVISDVMMRFLEEKFEMFCHGRDFVLLDAPLLFERGWDAKCDSTVTISTPEDVRWERVKNRPRMSREKFESIVGKQMTDEQRDAKADCVINGEQSPEVVLSAFQNYLSGLHMKNYGGRR